MLVVCPRIIVCTRLFLSKLLSSDAVLCLSSMDSQTVAAILANHGGSHQRVAAAAAAASGRAAGVDPPCEFADALLSLFGWGFLSAPHLQWLAATAQKAGANHPDVARLAALGSGGLYAGNMRRDVLRGFCRNSVLPAPLEIDVLGKDKLENEFMCTQSVLSLPAFVESIWRNHRGHFNEYFGEAPERFWDGVRDDDPRWATMGAVTAIPEWKRITYPLVLHGDGGTYSKKVQSSVLAVSIKSILSRAFSKNVILGFALPKDVRLRDEGWDTGHDVWAAWVHMLNHCYIGKHPTRDHRGLPWPAGSMEEKLAGRDLCNGLVRLAVWVHTGDLEYFGNELQFPHFGGNDPCWMCSASRRDEAEYSVLDLSPNAPWKDALLPVAEGIATPVTTHPIAGLLNFSRFMSAGDLMHTGALGVAAYFLGGALTDFLLEGPYTGSLDDRLIRLWGQIQLEYDAADNAPHRLTRITIGMFYHGNDTFPYFKGKAAENISMLYIVKQLCSDFNTGSRRDIHRLRCAEAICGMFDACHTSRWFLHPDEAAAMLHQCDRFLSHYNWLAREALERGRLRYNAGVKFHMLWHIAHHAKYLNPRTSWCFEFEDFVGDVIRSAKGSMAGTALHRVGHKVVENFLLVTQLRLRNDI